MMGLLGREGLEGQSGQKMQGDAKTKTDSKIDGNWIFVFVYSLT